MAIPFSATAGGPENRVSTHFGGLDIAESRTRATILTPANRMPNGLPKNPRGIFGFSCSFTSLACVISLLSCAEPHCGCARLSQFSLILWIPCSLLNY